MSQRVLVKNGKVIDGTGRPAQSSDLLIEFDQIIDVRPNIEAPYARHIDCAGKFITPGFIDMHSHSDLRLFVDPQIPQKIRQGVTSEVLGQDGISVAPVLPERNATPRA